MAFLFSSILLASNQDEIKDKKKKHSFYAEASSRNNVFDGAISTITIDWQYSLNKKNIIALGLGVGNKRTLVQYQHDLVFDSSLGYSKYKFSYSEADYYIFPLYLKYYISAVDNDKFKFGLDTRLMMFTNYLALNDDYAKDLPDFNYSGSYDKITLAWEVNMLFNIKLCNYNEFVFSWGLGFSDNYLIQPHVNKENFFVREVKGFGLRYIKFAIGYVF